MQKEIEVKVTGRVQGVMFRDFATRKARGLGIVGTVQNMRDGSVRIIALGEESALRVFLQKLERKPLLSWIVARVDTVEVKWMEPMHSFKNFAILYGYGG
ncbi:MAG: acylphosphatase [Candidatus Pacebacteria bacterium]|nr:acylphosphatase [Candidatus Paceibacterota bacterium]